MIQYKPDSITALAKRFESAAAASPKEFQRLRSDMRRGAGTDSRRAITAVYNITQSRVAEDQKVDITPLGFIVRGKGGKGATISAHGYKATEGGGGIKLRILKKGRVTTFKPGFFARTKNREPFYRKPGEPKKLMTKGRFAGKMRQPVHFLAGPSVADHMKDTRVARPMRERIWERTRKEFDNRIARLTRKK